MLTENSHSQRNLLSNQDKNDDFLGSFTNYAFEEDEAIEETSHAVVDQQLSALFDRIGNLEILVSAQLEVIVFYKEPERKNMIKEIGNELRQVGEQITAICDEKMDIISDGQFDNISMKPIEFIQDVYGATSHLLMVIILPLLEIYNGRLYKLGEEMYQTRQLIFDEGYLIEETKFNRSKGSDTQIVLEAKETIGKHHNTQSSATKLVQSALSDSEIVEDGIKLLDHLNKIGVKLQTFGIEMIEGFDSSQNILSVASFYDKFFIVSQFAFLIFYLFDVGSDVSLAINYLTTRNFFFFGLTLSCVLIPGIITSYIAYLWYTKWDIFGRKMVTNKLKPGKGRVHHDKRLAYHAIYLWTGIIFLLTLFSRYVELLWFTYKNQKNIAHLKTVSEERLKESERKREECKDFLTSNFMTVHTIFKRECEISFLGFLEAFMEGVPQLLLQLNILKMASFDFSTESHLSAFLQIASILTSLVGLALKPTCLYRTMRSAGVLEGRGGSLREAKSFFAGDAVLFLAHLFGIVSRVIVLSQFVSIYALPVFVLLHCGGMFYWQYRKYIVPNEISHKIPVHKLAVNFSWLGFVNIFNFVGFTFTPQSDGRMKLSFTLKDMFLNYKYFAVCFIENTFFLVLYVINADGVLGTLYDPIAVTYACSWYHTFFIVAQPICFFLCFYLLHIYPSLYSKEYQKWLQEDSEREDCHQFQVIL